jgi:probable F420-dependent oxidoreductase
MSLVSAVMTASDSYSPSALVDHARHLEALGYPALWVTDVFGREVYLTAGHILAHTNSLVVASGIAHIYGRDPIASAQAARTLSEFSGGRFVQGLGVSHPVAAEMRGVTWEDPVAKTRAYLSALRGQLPIHTPTDAPHVPIYLAAHGPKMLAVAAELADGANLYMQTPESCAAARAILGPDKVLNVLLVTCLSTDAAAARAAGRRALGMYLALPAYQRVWARAGFTPADWSDGGSDALIDTYVIWGDLDTIRERFGEFRAAGASDIVLAATPAAGDAASAARLLEALAPAAGS